jgi:hypothetical protein
MTLPFNVAGSPVLNFRAARITRAVPPHYASSVPVGVKETARTK